MRYYISIISLLFFSSMLIGQDHPTLILTKSGVADIRANMHRAPLFIATLNEVIKEVDEEILRGVKVPVPKDMSGGYTHEQHKRNFFILQKAGALFQITEDVKYAQYIKDCFDAYSEMYLNLPLHPTNRSYATGKIFWQCLNDANWLVYCSQAYDAVYEWLSKEDRNKYEHKLFRPMADFLSIENPQFFNRVHNHSTWANAAVGMIGLVMNDEELIGRALYGLIEDGIAESAVDNDGGYIKRPGEKKAGFYAQLDYSFSPDGHFTEGPYYLRYAMTPFLLFAQSLNNTRPALNIFEYRNGILEKAIYALINETDAKGRFFPINDAQKGMSWLAREVVSAIDIGYVNLGNDPMLLSIAELQNKVLLDQSGYQVAIALNEGKAQQFSHESISYKDGAKGDKGGLSILRTNNEKEEETCILVKYAAHGMGHGHFDRLSYSIYNENNEVIQDYGSARWVNIDQKGGGRYLLENQSFAKQTIAHNTVVLDQKSQNFGKVKIAESNSAVQYFESFENKNVQSVSVKDSSAYEGTALHRTVILLKSPEFENPLVVDLFRVDSELDHTYELPFWFKGHLLSTSFEYTSHDIPEQLGEDNGYQHIWNVAETERLDDLLQISWFNDDQFFTLSSASDTDMQCILGRLGANDPNFNLRPDPVIVLRKEKGNKATFLNVLESHGQYDPVTEIPLNLFSSISDVSILQDDTLYSVVQINHINGSKWIIAISNDNGDKEKKHEISISDVKVVWEGPIMAKKISI